MTTWLLNDTDPTSAHYIGTSSEVPNFATWERDAVWLVNDAGTYTRIVGRMEDGEQILYPRYSDVTFAPDGKLLIASDNPIIGFVLHMSLPSNFFPALQADYDSRHSQRPTLSIQPDPNGGVQLTWQSQAGKSYTVQYRTVLTGSGSEPRNLATLVGTGGPLTYTDFSAPITRSGIPGLTVTGDSVRFYNLKVE